MKPAPLLLLAAVGAGTLALAGYVGAQGNSAAARAAAPGQQKQDDAAARPGGAPFPPPLNNGTVDPGPRGGLAGAGGPLAGLTAVQQQLFAAGRAQFVEEEDVDEGLGPRFNATSCVACHNQPAVGGSSPLRHRLLENATAEGAQNSLPWFIAPNGPIREALRKVHTGDTVRSVVQPMFTITGRRDAPGCRLAQPNFLPAGNPLTGQGGNPAFSFRIPTPLFGAGLIEAIPDAVILANMEAQANFKSTLGIRGRPHYILSGDPNRNANDGTISRFGWKAQNKSLLIFAAEAYNVEMGVTNELLTDETEQAAACQFNGVPEDFPRFAATSNTEVLSDTQAFANFMRLLAAPVPAAETPSIVNGRALFSSVGCAACHTPALQTAARISPLSGARPSQPVPLYSDLLLHNMGKGLSDGVAQGQAGPDEFRTAPLWGLGQRIFFLHDGRTSDLREAIAYHYSSGSEATRVIERYWTLSVREQQDVLNFLRSL